MPLLLAPDPANPSHRVTRCARLTAEEPPGAPTTLGVRTVDPVSLIVTALVAGVAAGGKDAVSSLVKDAYAGLKALVVRRVAAQPAGQAAVEEHEKDPETWRAPVTKALAESGAATDDELLAAARRVLELTDPEGTAAGSYTIIASGERSVAAHTVTGNITTGDSGRAPAPGA